MSSFEYKESSESERSAEFRRQFFHSMKMIRKSREIVSDMERLRYIRTIPDEICKVLAILYYLDFSSDVDTPQKRTFVQQLWILSYPLDTKVVADIIQEILSDERYTFTMKDDLLERFSGLRFQGSRYPLVLRMMFSACIHNRPTRVSQIRNLMKEIDRYLADSSHSKDEKIGFLMQLERVVSCKDRGLMQYITNIRQAFETHCLVLDSVEHKLKQFDHMLSKKPDDVFLNRLKTVLQVAKRVQSQTEYIHIERKQEKQGNMKKKLTSLLRNFHQIYLHHDTSNVSGFTNNVMNIIDLIQKMQTDQQLIAHLQMIDPTKCLDDNIQTMRGMMLNMEIDTRKPFLQTLGEIIHSAIGKIAFHGKYTKTALLTYLQTDELMESLLQVLNNNTDYCQKAFEEIRQITAEIFTSLGELTFLDKDERKKEILKGFIHLYLILQGNDLTLQEYLVI